MRGGGGREVGRGGRERWRKREEGIEGRGEREEGEWKKVYRARDLVNYRNGYS